MEPVHIVSLGAGVQSTTMLLMAAHGEIEPKPKYAIFADTGWEPEGVYAHLDWLRKEVEKFGIEVIVTTGGNIKEDIKNGVEHGARHPSIPFFVKKANGKRGMAWRQCTRDYKIMPVRKKIRELLGYNSTERPKKDEVALWMGISTDEIMRAKESSVKYIKNVFPLLEKEMSREDCFAWMKEKGYTTPPKSACIGCPFHNSSIWKEMKKNDPAAFQDAVEIDRLIRNHPKFSGQPFLHRSCVPLDKVEFHEQTDLFEDGFVNECEGMCGL